VDLCAHVLETHSSQTRLFSKIVRQSWFRPIANLIERITIPGILLHYALRKKCIRELVRSAIANGVAQVVILGAGFDPLSSELQGEFPTALFWEIDHPATQRDKVRACSEIGTERVHFVAVDLSAAGLDSEALIGGGFDPAKRTFWIAEGLLMYFPADIVGDDFIGEFRFHVAQIIVIEKSNHTPRPYRLSKFTSRSSPEERLAASAQPPSNKFGLRIESNVAVPLFFHERKRKLGSGST